MHCHCQGVHQADAPVQVPGEDARRRDEEDFRLPQGFLGGIVSCYMFHSLRLPSLSQIFRHDICPLNLQNGPATPNTCLTSMSDVLPLLPQIFSYNPFSVTPGAWARAS